MMSPEDAKAIDDLENFDLDEFDLNAIDLDALLAHSTASSSSSSLPLNPSLELNPMNMPLVFNPMNNMPQEFNPMDIMPMGFKPRTYDAHKLFCQLNSSDINMKLLRIEHGQNLLLLKNYMSLLEPGLSYDEFKNSFLGTNIEFLYQK